MKPIKLLWMGDSPTLFTGFGAVAYEVLSRLAKTGKYEIACIGWGHNGWPYDREKYPYDIYPANGQYYGQDLFLDVVARFRPDVVICLVDPWTLEWMTQIQTRDYKSILYFPIDGDPIPQSWYRIFMQFDVCVAYTYYGQRIVQESFPTLKPEMIYHGVDVQTFRPLNKQSVKRRNYLENRFVVGCVARNQPRKQLPILIKAFAKFSADKEDAFLYLHTDPDDYGWDIAGLLRRYDLMRKSRIANNTTIFKGVSNKQLNEVYNLFDVKVLPSMGEGFGLPLVEAMAAGVPIVTTNYSANAELAQGRGELIAVKAWIVDHRYNSEVALADEDDLVDKLNLLYENSDLRQQHIDNGLAFAQSLDWEIIIKQWYDVLDRLCTDR